MSRQPEETLELFLSDNGGAYRAHETHAIARELGIKPIHTPVCSPQSNGMAESFVNSFKRDYVGQMDRSSAKAVPKPCQSRAGPVARRFYALQ
ncbi:MAG: integrase [Herminiimonas sp.]|nr:integrase [Herminiimonas sp.]